MKTKITKRKSGWTALVVYPWGAKVRILGLSTKAEAEKEAINEINRKRQYTRDCDLGIGEVGR